MQVYHLLYVGKSESEALYVVAVASVYSVELFEDFLLVLLLYAHARIADGEIHLAFLVPCAQVYVQRLVRFAVFYGIVE